jgi:hypothetical protein
MNEEEYKKAIREDKRINLFHPLKRMLQMAIDNGNGTATFCDGLTIRIEN